MLSSCQIFKAAFLTRCQERGMDLQQTHDLVKKALALASREKQADLLSWVPGYNMATGIASKLTPLAVDAGLASMVGLPIAAGGLAGWGAAKMQHASDESPEDAKARETIDAYRRAALRARLQQGVRKRRGAAKPSRPLLV